MPAILWWRFARILRSWVSVSETDVSTLTTAVPYLSHLSLDDRALATDLLAGVTPRKSPFRWATQASRQPNELRAIREGAPGADRRRSQASNGQRMAEGISEVRAVNPPLVTNRDYSVDSIALIRRVG